MRQKAAGTSSQQKAFLSVQLLTEFQRDHLETVGSLGSTMLPADLALWGPIPKHLW